MKDVEDPVMGKIYDLDILSKMGKMYDLDILSEIKKMIMESAVYQHSSKSILDKLFGLHYYNFYTEEQLHIMDLYTLVIRKQLTHDFLIEWTHQNFGKDVIYERKGDYDPVQVPSDFTKKESDIILGYFNFLMNKGIKKIERLNDDDILKIHYVDDKVIVLNTKEWRL